MKQLFHRRDFAERISDLIFPKDSGGNADFQKAYPDAKIWAGSDTPVMNELVKDGTSFDVGESITVKCHATPCHTQDSIAFYLEDKRSSVPDGEYKKAVFTG